MIDFVLVYTVYGILHTHAPKQVGIWIQSMDTLWSFVTCADPTPVELLLLKVRGLCCCCSRQVSDQTVS